MKLLFNDTVYVVGKYLSGENPDIVWDVVGIFTTKIKALAVISNDGDENLFVAPLKLNTENPENDWVGQEYPNYYGPYNKNIPN